jgi:hypothetical protein
VSVASVRLGIIILLAGTATKKHAEQRRNWLFLHPNRQIFLALTPHDGRSVASVYLRIFMLLAGSATMKKYTPSNAEIGCL